MQYSNEDNPFCLQNNLLNTEDSHADSVRCLCSIVVRRFEQLIYITHICGNDTLHMTENRNVAVSIPRYCHFVFYGY